MSQFVLRSAALIALMLAVGAGQLRADPASIKAAQKAVESWLALQDAGKYAETYEESAEYVKKLMDQQKWESAMQTHRKPLGVARLSSRQRRA